MQTQTISLSSASSAHWQTIQRYMPLLSLVPYTRAFFIVGSLAHQKESVVSDIDIVVEAREGRAWCNRLLMTSLLALLGKRRTKQKRARQFCINATVAEGGAREKVLKKIHKKWVVVDMSQLPLQKAKKSIEWIIESTFLGAVLERLAHFFLTKYIKKQFSQLPRNSRSICILSNEYIVYHPPKIS